MEENMRCDDCGTALGEIQIRVSDGLPVCIDCFTASQPKVEITSSPAEYVHDQQIQNRDAAYWRDMYRVMVRIIAAQHPDPAYAWLDELTRLKATRL